MLFKYKAKAKDGQIKEATLIAASKKEAGQQLRNENLEPLFVEAVKTESRRQFFAGRLPLIEKANFCRYLATMLNSGLPLTEAVEVLSGEAAHPTLKKILDEVRASVQKGQLLSTAFAKYPDVFDEVFLTLVRAGESSGTLDKSFAYLGEQYHADYELIQKIKSTLAYPVVVILATSGLGVGMLVFVVPRIAPVLLRLSETFPLPAHTLLILKIGLFLSQNIIFFGIGLAVAAVALGFFFATQRGKKILTAILSRLPVIKKFYLHLVLTRFCRTLSTLIASGVPIVDSLQVASGTLTLPRYSKLKASLIEDVSRGQSLAQVLKESRLFPPIMTSMVTTGEKTAQLDKLLTDLADFYQEEVTNSLKTMTDLIEPVLMLFIGLAVGAAVVSLIAPIYSFVGSLSQSIGG